MEVRIFTISCLHLFLSTSAQKVTLKKDVKSHPGFSKPGKMTTIQLRLKKIHLSV